MVFGNEDFKKQLEGLSHTTWTWALRTNLISNHQEKWLIFELPAKDGSAPVTMDSFIDVIYVEDYPEVRNRILEIIKGEIDAYDVLYRIRVAAGDFKWIYESCEVQSGSWNDWERTVIGKTWDVSALIDSQFDACEFEFDLLTQLPNRAGMIAYLREFALQSKKTMKQLTAVLFSIQGIETINSRESHAVGDYVLRRVADLLKTIGHPVGRIGSRYFLILCLGLPTYHVEKTCKILQEKGESSLSEADNKIEIEFHIREYWGEPIDLFLNDLEKAL